MSDHRSGIENDLHEAVQSYGSSVQPGDRLGEIRRATSAPPRAGWRQPWLLTAGAAAATAAVVVVGAVVLTRPDGTGQTPVASGDDQREVTVYEVREVGGQPWLYPENVTSTDTGDAVYDAVHALIDDGTGDQDDDRWVGCSYGQLESVLQSDIVVTVSLDGPAAICDMEPEYVRAQMQQLAWTVHDAIGFDIPVVIENAGNELTRQPLTADPAAISPVLLDAPSEGADVSSPVIVEGRGNTFEGNVQWQVRSGDEVIDEGFETAGTMGAFRPFLFTVDLPPGNYTVRAFALSMEDGSLFAADTTTFTVT